jgi:hypothetical protein
LYRDEHAQGPRERSRSKIRDFRGQRPRPGEGFLQRNNDENTTKDHSSFARNTLLEGGEFAGQKAHLGVLE